MRTWVSGAGPNQDPVLDLRPSARAIAAGGTDGYAMSAANMIVATTPSTTQMLSATPATPNIGWSRKLRRETETSKASSPPRAALIGDGATHETADAWIAAWEARRPKTGVQRGSAYWQAGWVWIATQRKTPQAGVSEHRDEDAHGALPPAAHSETTGTSRPQTVLATIGAWTATRCRPCLTGSTASPAGEASRHRCRGSDPDRHLRAAPGGALHRRSAAREPLGRSVVRPVQSRARSSGSSASTCS